MNDRTTPLRIGKYRIDRLLGTGAMGIVYLAFDLQIERPVALKTVRRDLFINEGEGESELHQRFRNEARAAGRLTHPNIVTVYDFGEDEGTAYIVMEYVSGKSLDSLLPPDEALSMSVAFNWLGQLLSALAYAHDAGVVHRDIKPANLLVTPAGLLKVADFGVACIGNAATSSGLVIGTPSFMSPEQFSGEAVDARSDLFSAGVMLYRMITGRQPFKGSVTAIMQQVMNEAPPRPSDIVRTLPPEIDRMLEKALAKRPEDRFDCATQWLSVLRTVAAASSGDDDRTVIAAYSPWRSSSAAVSGPPETAASGNWSPAFLERIERRLAAHIGPLARLIVRWAAAEAHDLPTLAEHLTRRLPDTPARRAFAREFERLASSTPTASSAISSMAQGSASIATPLRPLVSEKGVKVAGAIDQASIEAVAAKLAVYLGPIARLIAIREASQARNLDEFHQRVERCITSDAQRQRFKRDLDSSR